MKRYSDATGESFTFCGSSKRGFDDGAVIRRVTERKMSLRQACFCVMFALEGVNAAGNR